MDSAPPELTLDYHPNSYQTVEKPFGDQLEQTLKLREFIARLEEERVKIEAFKRELPLCMQLLNNAIETYKQQLESTQPNRGLEEFIPHEAGDTNGNGTATDQKANWMVSVQLWSQASDVAAAGKTEPVTPAIKESEHSFNAISPRNGGAFIPFSKEKGKGSSTSAIAADLSLASLEKKEKGGSTNLLEGQTTATVTTQNQRKARRCWSPELHRRFVNALQILGGSQVATPKQIRELMKVDGLTNDEVKSHLQKYRLHTRRPAHSPQPTATAAPQLVVLGGIWVPPEYATSASAAGYGPHSGQIHYCSAPVGPQDFYPSYQHVHLGMHRSLSTTDACKGRTGSPESELRSGGERSESIGEEDEEDEREDEANEEEEKTLTLVQSKAGESNGSGITLGF